MLARKALYGLKSSGAAFRAFLSKTLDAMGYQLSYYDPDLWLPIAVKPDGFDYYEYILCYVDNVLKLLKLMKRINKGFKLKDDKIETTEVYIGATIVNTTLESGKYC